jgi:putative hemolysin
MPKGFTNCVNSGGKLVTKKLKGNKYIHICYGKDGKTYTGEVKTRNKKNRASELKQKIKNSKAQIEDLRRLQKHFEENYRNG